MRDLNYTSVNEDWRTEAAALRLRPDDRVLCVTGSGDRPLDLLALAPARVVAIDLNPAQNHLLALKVAAMRSLPYDEYAAFLGLHRGEARWRRETLRRVLPELPPEARRFWSGASRTVESGVLYQGRWERFYRRVAAGLRLIWPRTVSALFEFDDLEAQRRFVRDRWGTPGRRATFNLACSPVVSRLCFGDPAYYAHVAVRPGRYLFQRMRAALARWLARENFMVSLVLRGTLPPADLPPYLTPDGYRVIRSRLDRLEVVTGELGDYLRRAPAGAFTRFSLSDVASYLTGEEFARLLDAVLRGAEPGARLCARQFLTRHRLPGRLAQRLVRCAHEEESLAGNDRSFAYDFIVAEVADD